MSSAAARVADNSSAMSASDACVTLHAMVEESDLIKGVRGWLDKQGYPLEMRVAAQFEKTDFHVLQSSYYVLPGQQPRELDVEAWFFVEDARLRWQPTKPKTPSL